MYQKMRSEAEKALPEWGRDALDRARSLVHPMYNTRMTYEEAANWVNALLPAGDPGRMEIRKIGG